MNNRDGSFYFVLNDKCYVNGRRYHTCRWQQSLGMHISAHTFRRRAWLRPEVKLAFHKQSESRDLSIMSTIKKGKKQLTACTFTCLPRPASCPLVECIERCGDMLAALTSSADADFLLRIACWFSASCFSNFICASLTLPWCFNFTVWNLTLMSWQNKRKKSSWAMMQTMSADIRASHRLNKYHPVSFDLGISETNCFETLKWKWQDWWHSNRRKYDNMHENLCHT